MIICPYLNITTNSKKFTLYNSQVVRFESGPSNIFIITLLCLYAFDEVHFKNYDKVKFKEIHIQYSFLNHWFGNTGISGNFLTIGKGNIQYTIPSPVCIASFADYKILVGINYRQSGNYNLHGHEIVISEYSYIKIEAIEEKPIKFFEEIIDNIENFLSFSMRRPVLPIKLSGYNKHNKLKLGEKVYYPTINIYRHGLKNINDSKFSNMLFRYMDISKKSDQLIKNWLKYSNDEKLKPIFDLYFGTLNDPDMYLNHRFLSLAQAIESYHRVTMNRTRLSKVEFKRRKQEIYDKVPNQKEWTQKVFEYANQIDLRSRLSDIYFKYRPHFNIEIINKDFFDKIRDNRNYLTHFDRRTNAQIVGPEELYLLSIKLQALLEICLLNLLGFNIEEIKMLFKRIPEYNNIFEY
jgi:hypothetical protein